MAVHDIEDPNFWKQIYYLTRAVYPALKHLRMCDKSEPSMDKMVYLAHRAEESLKKSLDVLNDESIFPTSPEDDGLAFEKAQMFDASLEGSNGNTGAVYQETTVEDGTRQVYHAIIL